MMSSFRPCALAMARMAVERGFGWMVLCQYVLFSFFGLYVGWVFAYFVCIERTE